MSLTAILESGRVDLLTATANLSDAQASAKPIAHRWSVLDCVEHLVTVEHRFLGWIANGTPVEPAPNPENELRLGAAVQDRSTKIVAPEAAVPTGRFTSLVEALGEFNAARDLSIRIATERGDGLYGIKLKHPRFGEMNGAELFHVMAGHARRHAEQIRETVSEQDILAAEHHALDRWGHGDPSGYLDLYAPTITYFDPTQDRRIDGYTAMAAYYEPIKGKIRVDRYEMLETKIQHTGAGSAVLSFHLTSHIKPADRAEFTVNWNCTEAYRHIGGAWKIVHSHWSYVKPELKTPVSEL